MTTEAGPDRAAHLQRLAAARKQADAAREAHTAAVAAEAEEYARSLGLLDQPEPLMPREPSAAELVARDREQGGDGTAGIRLALAQWRGLVGVPPPGERLQPRQVPEPQPRKPRARRPVCDRCAGELTDGRCTDPECPTP